MFLFFIHPLPHILILVNPTFLLILISDLKMLENTYPNIKWPFFTVFNFQEYNYTEHV
jgi:hypothetical protein